jgi:uncharacterized protein YfcZ (UPF0381/DUF406 family)
VRVTSAFPTRPIYVRQRTTLEDPSEDAIRCLVDLVTIIDANDSVGKNARIFDEVIEAQTYLAAVTAFDANFDR